MAPRFGLFMLKVVFISRFCIGVDTLCESNTTESLSVCSAGQVRGTYIQLNIRSYTQAVKCRCSLTVEQKKFITISTNRVPQTDDCKSQVILDFQSKRMIQCSSHPTYFFLTEENETGNVSFSTVANIHGRTEYSLYFCGPQLLLTCYDGELVVTPSIPTSPNTNTSPITNTSPAQVSSTVAENAAIIAASVLLAVVFVVLVVLALMVIVRRKRRNSFPNTMEQNYLPSVDTLKHDSTKENRDILDFGHTNEDSVYDTIEDNEGYLKSSDLRRNSSLRYSKAPIAHVPSKEEDENINNGYLEVLK